MWKIFGSIASSLPPFRLCCHAITRSRSSAVAARRAVYARDGFRCALCDDTRALQVHHYCHRSQGGNDTLHNLITLCWRCHAIAHGTRLPEYPDYMTTEEVEQACAEYLGDMYLDEWWPYK